MPCNSTICEDLEGIRSFTSNPSSTLNYLIQFNPRCQTRPACILYLILYIFLCVLKKVEKCGEDAFFVSSYNAVVLAIADGVSGYGTWAEQDVDPSLFPRELVANVSNLVGDEEVYNNPQILIGKANAYTSSIGSATVIIAVLERNGTLKIADVGDCGLRVIREGKINYSTSPQEHKFNCPYQLSSEIVGQTYHDAMVSNVELMEGDTVVMGSDGLSDNVFHHEIASTVAGYRDVAEAEALANLANNHSLDSNFDSPYSMEARSRGFEPPLWKKILRMKLTGTTYHCLYYDDKDLNLRCHDGPEFSVVQVESRMIAL